jgi:hypothetical protein
MPRERDQLMGESILEVKLFDLMIIQTASATVHRI